MCSGRKDLRDATTAADLSCHKGLTLAVSDLCGGDACRPTAHQILDHEALRSLVYRRFPTMLFSSAETVAAAIEGRPPSAKKKAGLSVLGSRMLAHLRAIASTSRHAFFAMPRVLFDQLPSRLATVALATSKNRTSPLPLAGAWRPEGGLLKLEPAGGPHMVEGLSIARDDDCRAVERDEEEHQQHADALLANMCVFRVAHGNPSRLKRPLDKEDDLSGNDIAIRLYDVVEWENCEEIRIRVRRSHGTDISCADLFTETDLQAITKTMIRLDADSKAAVVECSCKLLEPLVHAGAFPGRQTSFHDMANAELEHDMSQLQQEGVTLLSLKGRGGM